MLVIVALLLGGLLLPLSAQIELRNINDNRKAMAEIREALLGYAAVHGRLPCAAKPDLASQASGAGVEMTRGAGGPCDPSVLAGVLPWVTLGVSENDAWGRRYSYRVSSTFAQRAAAERRGQRLRASAAHPRECSLCPLCQRRHQHPVSKRRGAGCR